MIDRLIKYILIFTLASAVASCTDEILLDNQGIVEGDATVSSTIIFKDLAKSSLGGSRSAGNAVKQISNLCVLEIGRAHAPNLSTIIMPMPRTAPTISTHSRSTRRATPDVLTATTAQARRALPPQPD